MIGVFSISNHQHPGQKLRSLNEASRRTQARTGMQLPLRACISRSTFRRQVGHHATPVFF